MEIVNEIKNICIETENTWFLKHQFPQIALYDLELKERLEKEENIFNFDDRKCTCFDEEKDKEHLCIDCYVESEHRMDHLDKLLGVRKYVDYNGEVEYYRSYFDYDSGTYYKSKWIIPEKIDGEIPGFMLIECHASLESFTHSIVFVCVRPKFRKRGILKSMVASIPKEWNIYLQASNKEISNIEEVWQKCGFSYHRTIHNEYIIYKRV